VRGEGVAQGVAGGMLAQPGLPHRCPGLTQQGGTSSMQDRRLSPLVAWPTMERRGQATER
jgi:hypothetical protein